MYYLFNLKSFRGYKVVFLSLFVVGMAFSIFAPGNFVKLDGEGGISIFNIGQLISKVSSIVVTNAFWVFLFTLLLWFTLYRKCKLKTTCDIETVILLLAGVITIAFAIVIAYLGDRQFIPVVIFSIILCLRLIKEFFVPTKGVDILISCFCIVCSLGICIPAYGYRANLKTNFAKYCQNVIEAKDSVANSADFENYVEQTLIPSWYFKYINQHVRLCYDHNDIHNKFNHYLSKGPAIYSKVALPVSMDVIEKQCSNKTSLTDYCYNFVPDPNFFIIRVPEKVLESQIRILHKSQPLSRIERLKSYIFGVSPCEETTTLSSFALKREYCYNGWRYFIIVKPNYIIESDKLLMLKVEF